MSKRKMK